jgi:hypothetical protein
MDPISTFLAMSVQVLFEVTLQDTNVMHTIANKLKYLDIQVLPYSKEEIGTDAFDPDHIMCMSLFPEAQWVGLMLAQKSVLENLEGVKQVNIMHHSIKKEKRKWYDHFTIPLLISAVIYALTVLTVLLGVSTDFNIQLDPTDYILYLIIPPVIMFFVGILYIRYRQIF